VSAADLDLIVLQDWRRRVSELYARARSQSDPAAGWQLWRNERDRLFASHSASPLPAQRRAGFTALALFPYDPDLRVHAEVQATEPIDLELATSDGSSYPFTRFACARFALAEAVCELELYWLQGYAGGLFVPFTDASTGESTYGGGRYLLDTAKGADLGQDGDRLIFDFNFAYNPSCSYDPLWSCPLASGRNRLPVPVSAGERAPS
jgi:uncharacterized protein (DUF1684 family)